MNKQYGLLSSLLLALVLSLGTGIVWGVLWGFWEDRVIERQVWRHGLTESGNEDLFFPPLRIAIDGTAVIDAISDSGSGTRIRTLDGDDTDLVRTFGFDWIPSTAWLTESPTESLAHSSIPVEWPRRILVASDRGFAPQYWYLIHDGRPKGSAWLEGFDSTNKQRVGYIGRNGYRNTPPTADDLFPMVWHVFQELSFFDSCAGWSSLDQFREISSLSDRKDTSDSISPWVTYLVTDGSLVEIDLRERKVRTLLEDLGIVFAIWVSHLTTESTFSTYARRRFIAARSADRLWIVDPLTNQSRELPIPDGLENGWPLHLFLLDDQILHMIMPTQWGDPFRLLWFSRDGRLLNERAVSVPLPNYIPFSRPFNWGYPASLPMPIVHAMNFFRSDLLEHLQEGPEAICNEAWRASWRRWRASFVALCMVSIPLALWCFRRHRRYAQPGAWAWFVFVLLLGPPGLIGYLLHRRWPIREPCPACGRPAVVDRDTCQHCGTAFPTPELQGIEVLG